jgi:hypothetical protein
MKTILTMFMTLIFLSLVRHQLPASTPAAFSAAPSPDELPLVFVPEDNQAAPFTAIGLGGRLAFQPSGVAFSRGGGDEAAIRFLGANPAPRLTPGAEQPGRINRYLGNDPARWESGIPSYGRLRYDELYPGITLDYEGRDGRLKGTFTVAPGSDPGLIAWRYDGASSVRLDEASGALQIRLRSGLLTESAPVAWQVVAGEQVPVAVRFTLDGVQAGFAVGTYDARHPLVIDPEITFSTFLGGLSSDFIHDISVDSAGNVYVAGWTYTNNLGGFPNTVSGYNDAFVARLNPAGTAWQWITYLGGNDHEQAYGVAANSSAVWLTGYTDSSNYPTTANGHQRDFGGYYDLILSRLNPANGVLTYSTLFGYDNLDEGRDVALDADGNVYVTGQLSQADVLALKFSGGTSPTLAYAVMWGDDYAQDIGYGIAVDDSGQVYITGMRDGVPSGTSNFPIENGVQTECGRYTYTAESWSCTTDAFVSVLNAAGDALVYSTFLGGSGSPDTGSGSDEGRAIALDAQGNIYVTGITYAADFPTVNAADPSFSGPSNKADAWVTKLSANGQTILYATYLGGTDDDQAQDIVADGSGNAYVTGYTRSSDFPVASALQTNLGEGGVCFSGSTQRACYDAFLTQIGSGGSIAMSTYLGRGWDEFGYGLARTAAGDLYVAGVTNSPGYPTTAGAPQRTLGGNEDGFITRIGSGTVTPPPYDHALYLPYTVR